MHLHLLISIQTTEQLIKVKLCLASLPEMRAKALKIHFHILDLLRTRQTAVEIENSDHRAGCLLKLHHFLCQSLQILLRTVANLPLLRNSNLRLLHLIDTILHLLLYHEEPSLQWHDIVCIRRDLGLALPILTYFLYTKQTERSVLCNA